MQPNSRFSCCHLQASLFLFSDIWKSSKSSFYCRFLMLLVNQTSSISCSAVKKFGANQHDHEVITSFVSCDHLLTVVFLTLVPHSQAHVISKSQFSLFTLKCMISGLITMEIFKRLSFRVSKTLRQQKRKICFSYFWKTNQSSKHPQTPLPI